MKGPTEGLVNGSTLARVLWPGLALILLMVAAALALEWSGLGELIGKDWVDHTVRGHGLGGELLFVAAAAGGMAIGLPRQVVSFLAGYAFGLLLGSTLALAATVLACVGSYGVANLAVRLIGWRPRDGRLIAFLRDHTFHSTLLIRLLPAGNNLATCLAAGGARIPLLAFTLGSALGYVPQTLVFVLLGSGMQVEPVWRVGGGLLLFLASAVLGLQLVRRYRRQLSGLEAAGVAEPAARS